VTTATHAGQAEPPAPAHRRPARALVRQLGSFAAIGVASTLAYLVLYLLLREALAAQPANAIALFLTAVGNTAANRRLTFGVRGRQALVRQQLEGLGVFAVGLAFTSGSLALLHVGSSRPARAVEVLVLVLANAAATLARFLLLRGWVFHPRRVRARDRVPPTERLRA
jgi:putative flippase GtrA